MHRRSPTRPAAGCPARVFLASAFVACLAVTGVASADKSDVILFKNGDRLTGEVKALDRGKAPLDILGIAAPRAQAPDHPPDPAACGHSAVLGG